jgi:uncharacterized protein YjiS (DUF1127 family)
MFDEEPNRDPHGECAMEIHRLQRQVSTLYEALDWWHRDARKRGEAVRLLQENLDDVDKLEDGRINTTRVRELLEPITRDTDDFGPDPRDEDDPRNYP